MKHPVLIFYLLLVPALGLERDELVALVREKQFDQAFALIEGELKRISETDSEARARLYSYQGELFLKTQRPDQAVESFVSCLAIRNKLDPNPKSLLETHLRIARAQVLAEHRLPAAASYQKAIGIGTSLEDRNMVVGLKAELAELFLKMGDLPEAWKLMHEEELEELSDDVAIHWLSVRSKVSFASGSYAEAYQRLRDASQRFDRTSQKDLQTGLVIAMESCALAQRLNRPNDASLHLQEANRLVPKIGIDQLSASVRWSLAVLDAELSEAGKDSIYLQMATTFESFQSDGEFVASGAILPAQVKLASLALDAKFYPDALKWCDRLDANLPEVNSFRALLHRYRAAAWHHQNRPDLAQQQAIESAKAAQRWLQENRVFGTVENLIGLENSVDLLSPLVNYTRTENRPEVLRKFLLENHDDGLSHWIQLRRFLNHSDQREKLRNLFLGEAPSKSENMAIHFHEWSKLQNRPIISRQALPDRGTLVHYFIYRNEDDENHYGAIVCQADQTTRYVELGQADLIHRRVQGLLTASEMQATDASYRGTSPIVLCEALYDLLWEPLKIADQEVVIRPAGMLQFVPWPILHKPGAAPDAGYLCQLYRSLRVVACSRHENSQEAASLRLSLLGVARQQDYENSDANSLIQPEKFANLPGVIDEFSAIRDAGIVPIYQNTSMSADVFRDPKVLSSTMLHLSCHGFVKPTEDPLQDGAAVLRQSGMIFHDYGKNEKGLMYVGDAVYLALDNINAMVLSLCRGGLSNHAGLENWSSLRRAFLAAGAKHVAAAQWEIVDDDMQYFMKSLYMKIHRGMPLPAALQSSQCDWIEGRIPHANNLTPAMRIATGGAWVVESAGW